MMNKILWTLLLIFAVLCVTVLIKYANKVAVADATLEQIKERYNILSDEYQRIRKEYEELIKDENL